MGCERLFKYNLINTDFEMGCERLSKYILINADFENKKELKGFDPTCPSSSALRRNIRRLKTKRLILANTSVHDSLNPIRNCVFFPLFVVQ